MSRPCDRSLPYLVLLPMGFAVPPNVATGAVRSYRTISPLPAPLARHLGGIFLLHCPWAHAPQVLPGIAPYGARTFLHALACTATAWPTPGCTLRSFWAISEEHVGSGGMYFIFPPAGDIHWFWRGRTGAAVICNSATQVWGHCLRPGVDWCCLPHLRSFDSHAHRRENKVHPPAAARLAVRPSAE
jgi:hypothetical protein